jgi:hypothetical protein
MFENCPDEVFSSGGSFDLRGFIELYQSQSIEMAQAGLDQSLAAGPCSQYANVEECDATVELNRKVIAELKRCSSSSSSSEQNRSNSTGKKTFKRERGPTDSFGKSSDPLSLETLDISDRGCPYVYTYVPNYYHSPNSQVCLGNTTLTCSLAGKLNNEQNIFIYTWRVTNKDSCIQGSKWIDAKTIEKNKENLYKQR